MAARSSRARLLLTFSAILLLGFLTCAWWLPVAGFALVHDDGPAKADIAVVPAGDFWGHRILKAAELARDGYVPQVLVSGPSGFYGLHESDLAIPFAVRAGFPGESFVSFPNSARSTREEAVAILPELRRRNVKSFLLVTSDYHSGRARRTYLSVERSMGGGPPFRVVTAPDEYFRAGSWWKAREARKTVFFEWSKTLGAAFGF